MIKATVLASVALVLIASFSLSGCNDAQMAILDAQMSDSPVSEAEAVSLFADLLKSAEEEQAAEEGHAAAPQQTYAPPVPWTITNGPNAWARDIWRGLERSPTGVSHVWRYQDGVVWLGGGRLTPLETRTGIVPCRQFTLVLDFPGTGELTSLASREIFEGDACRTKQGGWVVQEGYPQLRTRLAELGAIRTQ